MTAMLFSPLAKCTVDGVEDSLMAFDYVWVGALLALCALLAFVIVWLFKNRLLQIRLCVAEMVLLAGAQGFSVWYALRATGALADTGSLVMSNICTPVVFPGVSFILCLLAVRAIFKDEKLVRSLNRIR